MAVAEPFLGSHYGLSFQDHGAYAKSKSKQCIFLVFFPDRTGVDLDLNVYIIKVGSQAYD